MNGPNEFALVSCGRLDKFAPECSEELQRGRPRATRRVFEHSSHMSHLEEPERFLATTADFLDAVEAVA